MEDTERQRVYLTTATEATMEKCIFELAKTLRNLCKNKEEYIEICKKNGISEKYILF